MNSSTNDQNQEPLDLSAPKEALPEGETLPPRAVQLETPTPAAPATVTPSVTKTWPSPDAPAGSPASSWIETLMEGSGIPSTPLTESDRKERTAPATPFQPPAGGGPHMVGDYEIVSELGRGGMGVVYQARQVKANRIVALKMVLSGQRLALEQKIRFQIEAEAVARLTHPNIVQLFEVGEQDGQPFFSLEFCAGGSLDRKLNEQPQPAEAAAILVEKLARAMHYAHSRGVVHRDLKPANVLLTADGEPKITDFGLAKRLDTGSNLSRSGLVVGTASYMAPEQARGAVHEVGPAADVWALGAVLYECLTGCPPFRGATVYETMRSVLSEEPALPSSLNEKVPRDLETICIKCLNKEPGGRYGSALELAEDLRRYREGEPILARPAARWERAWKWARREPAKAAAIGAVTLALLAGTAGTILYGLYTEQRAKEATAKARQLEKQQEQQQKLDRLRNSAEEAEVANRFVDAYRDWTAALAVLDNDPNAVDDDLRSRLEARRKRVRELLAERARADAERNELLTRRKDFTDRVKRFDRARYEVVFHAISISGESRTADTMVVRRAAPEALEELGLDVTKRPEEFAGGFERFRACVESPAQLDKLANDCYQILLAWSAAEMTPGAAADDAEASPRRALRLLDAAAALAAVYPLEKSQAYHLRRAQVYEQLDKKTEATAERERAKDIAPTAVIDLFEAALQHFRKGEFDLATADCERVLQREPNDFWTQYVSALCNLQQKQWSVALVRLEACLEKRPNSPWLLMHRALAHAGAKNFSAAEADFERVLRDAPSPSFRAIVLTNRSTVWIQQQRWTDAEHDLLQAIELRPKAYQGYVNLAMVYQQQGKRAEAVRAMNKAIECQPQNANLYLVRARLQLARGEEKAARQDYEEFLAREPKGDPLRWAESRVEVARFKLKAGEIDQALADCDAVLQVVPNFAAAHRQRAEVLLRQEQYNKAGQALESYLAAGGPVTPEIQRARGLILSRSGKHAEATAAFTRALILRGDADIYSLRGWEYVAREAARPALDDFDAALALEKTHLVALRGRATALVLLGRMPEAEVAAEAALKQGERTPDALLQVARIFSLAVGQRGVEGNALRFHDRALKLLREAMGKLPDDEARRTFWKNKVEKSPAFLPLRNSAGMLELSRMYGSGR